MKLYGTAVLLAISTSSYGMHSKHQTTKTKAPNYGIESLTNENRSLQEQVKKLQDIHTTLAIRNKNLVDVEQQKNNELVQQKNKFEKELLQKKLEIKKLTEERNTWFQSASILSQQVIASEKKPVASSYRPTGRDLLVAVLTVGSAIALRELYEYYVHIYI